MQGLAEGRLQAERRQGQEVFQKDTAVQSRPVAGTKGGTTGPHPLGHSYLLYLSMTGLN